MAELDYSDTVAVADQLEKRYGRQILGGLHLHESIDSHGTITARWLAYGTVEDCTRIKDVHARDLVAAWLLEAMRRNIAVPNVGPADPRKPQGEWVVSLPLPSAGYRVVQAEGEDLFTAAAAVALSLPPGTKLEVPDDD